MGYQDSSDNTALNPRHYSSPALAHQPMTSWVDGTDKYHRTWLLLLLVHLGSPASRWGLEISSPGTGKWLVCRVNVMALYSAEALSSWKLNPQISRAGNLKHIPCLTGFIGYNHLQVGGRPKVFWGKTGSGNSKPFSLSLHPVLSPPWSKGAGEEPFFQGLFGISVFPDSAVASRCPDQAVHRAKSIWSLCLIEILWAEWIICIL